METPRDGRDNEAYFRHEEYLAGFVPLSLWYASKASEQEREPLGQTIATRTNLYRNSIFDDCGIPSDRSIEDDRWRGVLEEIEELHGQLLKKCSTSSFEKKATEHLRPYIEPTIERSLSRYQEVIARSPFGCWRYDIVGNVAKIHIANAYRPESPLGSRFGDFHRSLGEMLRRVKDENPTVDLLFCGSWMNSIEKFQNLFPKEWIESGKRIIETGPGLGEWGQFMDRQGGFHEGNGIQFRSTGHMPFPCIECTARLDETIDHLGH